MTTDNISPHQLSPILIQGKSNRMSSTSPCVVRTPVGVRQDEPCQVRIHGPVPHQNEVRCQGKMQPGRIPDCVEYN